MSALPVTLCLLREATPDSIEAALQEFPNADSFPYALWQASPERILTPWVLLVGAHAHFKGLLLKMAPHMKADAPMLACFDRGAEKSLDVIWPGDSLQSIPEECHWFLRRELLSEFKDPRSLATQKGAFYVGSDAFSERIDWKERLHLRCPSRLLVVWGGVVLAQLDTHPDESLRIQWLAQETKCLQDLLDQCQQWSGPPMLHPKVSVIVSTYASADFIEECYQDLANQTWREQMEVIVVDAYSPQNELEKSRSWIERMPGWRYVRVPWRIGIYPAWNLAWSMARGSYVLPFSTNDRLATTAVQDLAEHLDLHPQALLAYGDSLLTDKPHQQMHNYSPSAIAGGAYRWPELGLGTLLVNPGVGPHPMWRNELQHTLGRFDMRYSAIADQDFFIRVAKRKGLTHITSITGMAWLTTDSLSGNCISRFETLDIQLRHYLSIAKNMEEKTKQTLQGMYLRFYKQDLQKYRELGELSYVNLLEKKYGTLMESWQGIARA